jgi:hypothetical protein
MASVQSFIRAEVSRGTPPEPKGVKTFKAYAIASAKGLIPEMENTARLTLDQPMTFGSLGEGLRLFEGWALRDLVDFRRRCKDNVVACLDSYHEALVPSSSWVGCPEVMPTRDPRQSPILPKWIDELFLRNREDLKLQKITRPLDIHSKIIREYYTALENHDTCNFCLRVHMRIGLSFCLDLEKKLAQARNKVSYSLYFSSTTRFTSRRYAVFAALPALTHRSLRNR